MLSDLIAMGYFLGFLYHIRKNTVIAPNPKAFSTKQHIPGEVLSVGLPGFVMTMMFYYFQRSAQSHGRGLFQYRHRGHGRRPLPTGSRS